MLGVGITFTNVCLSLCTSSHGSWDVDLNKPKGTAIEQACQVSNYDRLSLLTSTRPRSTCT